MWMFIDACMGALHDFLIARKNNVERKIIYLLRQLNDKEMFMSMIEKLYAWVATIHNFFVGDELLVDYCFSMPISIRKQRQVVVPPLEVSMGWKNKEIKWYFIALLL